MGINKKAFSLLELSIVILIIGLLIAGVVATKSMVTKSRLTTAQTLTKTSPVNEIPNLYLWLETSLTESFREEEIEDGASISTWHDINPQAVNQATLQQLNSNNQPKFYGEVFNGAIPAIRFDGTDDFINFDGTPLVNSSYTIFVVEQRRSGGSGFNPIIGGSDGMQNANLALCYNDDANILQSHFANDLTFSVDGYTIPIPRIHTLMFNSTSGKNYWMNGGNDSDATAPSQTETLVSYDGSALGKFLNNYFNGDLAEVIIFTRSLKTEEKLLVENYLNKKYNIDLN
jgi:prepilin-type N-terminal cleavage/methylation domain-containing protein